MHILPICVILYIYQPNIKAARNRNNEILIYNINNGSDSDSNGISSMRTN